MRMPFPASPNGEIDSFPRVRLRKCAWATSVTGISTRYKFDARILAV
jgi:hypothetical protein